MPDLFETTDHERDAERERIRREMMRFAKLAAGFALTNFALTLVNGPAPFAVSRWGLCREFETLDAAERFLADVTGAKP